MNKELIAGIIRHVLGALGASGATVGYLTQDEISMIAGGGAALIALAWSAISKMLKKD